MYHLGHMGFGTYINERREDLASEPQDRRSYSLRQVANRVGIQPSYLSKVERELVAPPSEATIRALARELGEDADFLLALADKVAQDILDIIMQRPQVFCTLIRRLKKMPTEVIDRMMSENGDNNGL